MDGQDAHPTIIYSSYNKMLAGSVSGSFRNSAMESLVGD